MKYITLKKVAFVQRSSCVVNVWLSILASFPFSTPSIFNAPAFSTPAFSVAPHIYQIYLCPCKESMCNCKIWFKSIQPLRICVKTCFHVDFY